MITTIMKLYFFELPYKNNQYHQNFSNIKQFLFWIQKSFSDFIEIKANGLRTQNSEWYIFLADCVK